MRFTGPNGNTVFLPAAGRSYEGGAGVFHSEGCYWSSSLKEDNPSCAHAFHYFEDYIYENQMFSARCVGLSVRPVCKTSWYTINIEAAPTNRGSVNGGGIYGSGQPCTVFASAFSGYSFTNWTENGTIISTNPYYTFSVNCNRDLVANFIISNPPQAPSGAINGLFSVSPTQQVYFSQGNLQYQASTNTWKLATNQWDIIGQANENISPNNSGWIDLFGWGTSNFNHGAVCYQPWSTSTNYADYFAYGNNACNLYDQTGRADWGSNAISCGGNTSFIWRTLSKDEWMFVLNLRSTASGIRYAKATVNDVNGVVLLPDDWEANAYSLNNTNNCNAGFMSNSISLTTWMSVFDTAGAVFLPVTGYRWGSDVEFYGQNGFYYSATTHTIDGAYILTFNSGSLEVLPNGSENGCCVRLVQDAERR